MKLTATREEFLAPLQSVIGVVERRQTMPVLANVLLSARDNRLSITGTDLEVELVATKQVSVQQAGDVTIPGRKLLDIFKSLPEKTSVTLSTEGERVSIRGGRSRFTLSSLPATDFPVIEEINAQQTLTLEQGEFRRLIDKTHFSMAQQDVRYYLNGLLLETDGVVTLTLSVSFLNTVEEWDVWPQGPRLQGEDGGKAGARGSNKTTEQPNNRTSTRHRDIIDTHQSST